MGGALIMKPNWILLAVSLFLMPGSSNAEYREQYASALDAIEQEDWERADLLLRSVIQHQPRSAPQVRLYGMRFVPYVPWLQLGIVREARADCAGAVAAWEYEIEQGVAQQDPVFERLREGMGACGARIPAPGNYAGDTAAYRAVASTGSSYRHHYRTALDHLALAEHELAEEALQAALDDNATPQSSIRLYGMRFVPYVPFYKLAATRLVLGDCSGAEQAWDLSKTAGVALEQPMTEGFDVLLASTCGR